MDYFHEHIEMVLNVLQEKYGTHGFTCLININKECINLGSHSVVEDISLEMIM